MQRLTKEYAPPWKSEEPPKVIGIKFDVEKGIHFTKEHTRGFVSLVISREYSRSLFFWDPDGT